MAIPTPRTFVYRQADAILTVGIDPSGRLFSHIEKNGEVKVRDIFVRLPSEAQLAKAGWKRES